MMSLMCTIKCRLFTTDTATIILQSVRKVESTVRNACIQRLQMAPTLTPSQHVRIRDLIADGSFKYVQVANAATCSRDAVKAISANLRRFGSTAAPNNGTGRPKWLTPNMLDVLREHLVRPIWQHRILGLLPLRIVTNFRANANRRISPVQWRWISQSPHKF